MLTSLQSLLSGSSCKRKWTFFYFHTSQPHVRQILSQSDANCNLLASYKTFFTWYLIIIVIIAFSIKYVKNESAQSFYLVFLVLVFIHLTFIFSSCLAYSWTSHSGNKAATITSVPGAEPEKWPLFSFPLSNLTFLILPGPTKTAFKAHLLNTI